MNQFYPSTDAPPIQILVVDDHPNTATTLARALSQLGPGVEVRSATSGNEALEYVNEGAVDILITDMIMPEMTGLELIEKLQSHPAGRPTFSFLITAYDVPGLKVTARRLKVKDVIIKPVRPERICQIITQALQEMILAKPNKNETAAGKSFKSFKILIADDQPDNLMLLSRYLESEGYAYITAKDGLEAFEKIRSELPDLVLLDVNMPKKHGFAVLEEIRADPATKHIPVIILTAARLDPIEIQSGLNLGADDYVTKPFDRRELFARIRTKLRVKEAEDTLRRRNRELNLLPEIGKELSARLDMQDLANVLLKRTVETLGALFGHIVILNEAGLYQQTYQLGAPADTLQFSLPQALLEIVKDTRQGFIIEDTQTDARWQSKDDVARSAVIVPMFGRHNLLGVLALTNEQTGYFTLDNLLLLQAITSQASIAIENSNLYASAIQHQNQLSAILQSIDLPILMFDKQGKLNQINPMGALLFTDNKIDQFLSSDQGYEPLMALMNEARQTHSDKSGEVAWPDQRSFFARITSMADGSQVAVLRDVTHSVVN